MGKSKQRISMSKYMTMLEAARMLEISQSALYQAIKRGGLRFTMIKGKKHTSKEWLNSYLTSKNNRDRVFFQGKPLYDYHKGEWSVKMTAYFLKTSINIVHMMLRRGDIKSFRRGIYHIVRRETVLKMQDFKEKQAQELVQEKEDFKQKKAYFNKMLYEKTG